MGRGAGLALERDRTWVKKAGPGEPSRQSSRGVAVAWWLPLRPRGRPLPLRGIFRRPRPPAPHGSSASLSESQYNPGASCTSPMNAKPTNSPDQIGR
jgi:hypothetical protein